MLPNLTQLTVEQIDEALTNAGYTDNQLSSATFVRRNDDGDYIYRVTANNETGKVWVSVNPAGLIVADY